MNIVKAMKLVKGDVNGVIRNDGNRGNLIISYQKPTHYY